MIMRLTLVSEEDYPALKCICERSVTGDNYQDYLQRLLERREDLEKSGTDVLIVPMSPDAFVAHFEERRKATWPDLIFAFLLIESHACIVSSGGIAGHLVAVQDGGVQFSSMDEDGAGVALLRKSSGGNPWCCRHGSWR